MSFQRRLKKEGVEGLLFNILILLDFCVLYPTFNIVSSTFYSSEMIDGCRALLSIGTVTTPVVFDRLLRSIRSLACDFFFAVKSHLLICYS